jgi:hypothetical protein
MSERDPRLYLSDILESAKAIVEYVKGLSLKEFRKDRKTCSAVVREFEIIGEAVGKSGIALTLCGRILLKERERYLRHAYRIYR